MLELVPVTPDLFEFIRRLRLHPANAAGFIEQSHITPQDQVRYMRSHAKDYRVCMLDGAVSYTHLTLPTIYSV